MILISGTQGEPMSALSRAAVDNHKHARVERGDTVVLSSRVIPGNEKSIYRVIDHLCRREANVIYDDGESGLIHVSGHGSKEEMRLMINLLRPKTVIPMHFGTFPQLTGTPHELKRLVPGVEVLEMKPGVTIGG